MGKDDKMGRQSFIDAACCVEHDYGRRKDDNNSFSAFVPARREQFLDFYTNQDCLYLRKREIQLLIYNRMNA